MKTKTMLATAFTALVVALAPAAASGDAGSAVQADLTQLGTDVGTAHTTLVADLANVATSAQAGDTTGVKAAVLRLHADAATVVPPIRADRRQLATDLKTARTSHVTGLGADVRAAVKADRTALREIRQAARQARQAVRALKRANRHAHP